MPDWQDAFNWLEMSLRARLGGKAPGCLCELCLLAGAPHEDFAPVRGLIIANRYDLALEVLLASSQ